MEKGFNKDPAATSKDIINSPARLVCTEALYRQALQVTTSIKAKQSLRKILRKEIGTFNNVDKVSIL